jgi:hypothetical protein
MERGAELKSRHLRHAASGEFLPVIIDLLLRVAVDHERDGFGELELRVQETGVSARAVQGRQGVRAYYRHSAAPTSRCA